MEVTYTTGPRYIDGINIDADVDATTHIKQTETSVDQPVTGLEGKGYEPGQLNKDGTPL